MRKYLTFRGIRIDKVGQSRYNITQGQDTFKFGSWQAAVDFANFICEDKERERQQQIKRLQQPSLDWKSFPPKSGTDEGDSGT